MTINHSSREEIDVRQLATIDGRHLADDGPYEAAPGVGASVLEEGAIPKGSEARYWTTAMARPDATHPSTMPHTKSTPMPGERNHASRNQV